MGQQAARAVWLRTGPTLRTGAIPSRSRARRPGRRAAASRWPAAHGRDSSVCRAAGSTSLRGRCARGRCNRLFRTHRPDGRPACAAMATREPVAMDVHMKRLRDLLVWVAGGALLVAMVIDTSAMLGRQLHLPLLGAIEIVQAAVLFGSAGALLLAALE